VCSTSTPRSCRRFQGVDAQAQALAYGVRITGCTVHLVDAGVDTGPILAQAAVPVLPGDDRERLAARILGEEHRLYVEVLRQIAAGRLFVEEAPAGGGRKARVARCEPDRGRPRATGAGLMQKHYDVIVLGRSIGALTAAALLARRDFTVLVLGNGALAPTYTVLGRELRRRVFTFLAATSPAWQRVIVELAQSQTWRRRIVAAVPMLQALGRGLRLDVPADRRALRARGRSRDARAAPRGGAALRGARLGQRAGRRGLRRGRDLAAGRLLGAA
jgi:hypothetical protein